MSEKRKSSAAIGAPGLWWAGLWAGLRTLPTAPILGLKRLFLPVSYWRTAEFAYVWRRLVFSPAARVLDVGSPKDLAVFLARHRGYELVATDIMRKAVDLSERYSCAQGLAGEGPGRVKSEVQDGRSLSYPDGSFDAAYSVSVIEHIPDSGDTEAIRELVRVVRPGGLVVITTPFADSYYETFVNCPVYERLRKDGKPVFFERHYDEIALEKRLLEPSAGQLLDLELWGEGFVRVERLLGKLGWLAIPLSPLEALLSAAFLRRVPPGGRGHRMAAFFTLRKS